MKLKAIMRKKRTWILLTLLVLGTLFMYLIPQEANYAHKLVASDSHKDLCFGQTITTDDRRIVVGAQGAVYLYELDQKKNEYRETKISVSLTSGSYLFADSIAISGDVIVVGYSYENKDKGAAHIFRWDGTTWQETVITASDGAKRDYFGHSVAINGNTVAIGAWFNNKGAGAVYIYKWDGTAWKESTKLTTKRTKLFGGSVAMSGDRIAVGARGATFVYTSNGKGYTENIVKHKSSFYDEFNFNVAIEEDTLAIGAYDKFSPVRPKSGATLIYKLQNSVWNLVAEFTLAKMKRFTDSWKVHINDGRVVTSSTCVWSNYNVITRGFRSSPIPFYIYDSDSSGWHQAGPFYHYRNTHGPWILVNIAATEDKILIGSAGEKNGGAVYIYDIDGFAGE